MKVTLFPSDTRGHAYHGWLDTYHSFSFARYYDPDKMNFGALRVLNDDTVAAGHGFGTHPHDNMEIISIPLEGDLEHKDSMGNVTTIKTNDVQVMSAGSGITHSEYNPNEDTQTKFLQIWIVPNKRDVEPRYDQISIDETKMRNNFLQVVSPNINDDGVWIHQEAWLHMAQFDADTSRTYSFKKENNGLYLFVLEGRLEVAGNQLNERDALSITETNKLSITATEDSRFLLIEVPMIDL